MRIWNSLLKAWLLASVLVIHLPLESFGQTNSTTNVVVGITAGRLPTEITVVPKETVRLTFWLDRLGPLRESLFGFPIWEYIAIAIYILIALLVARLLDYMVAMRLKIGAAKTPTKLDDWIFRLLRGPLKLIVFIVFLHIGLQIFQWPDWIAFWLKKGLYVVIGISLMYMGLGLADLLINQWRLRAATKEDTTFNEQLFPIVTRSIKGFVILIAVLVTAENLDVNIRSAIGALSVGGLALGLAAQDTFANLFGAMAIFIDKPFKLGDSIRLDAFEGNVESIGLRSTRLRNPDGHLITVPNKTMGNTVVTNITRRPNFRTLMNLGVTYDTSMPKLEEAIAILEDILGKHPLTHDKIVSFNRFADSALNIHVLHWMKAADYKEYMRTLHLLNMSIKQRFDAAGIVFAFPSQTVFLKQDSPWRLSENDSQKELQM